MEADRRTALLVVDVQRDFCEGGSLAVPGGEAAAAGISDLIEASDGAYALIVASRDWHVDPGSHFARDGAEPDYVDSWPVHCVAGTDGADWHPDLRLPGDVMIVSKGATAASYSAFDGTCEDGRTLAQALADAEVSALDIAGIATSFCVRASALDALAAGFDVRVLAPLTADVDAASTPTTLEELRLAGVAIAG